MMLFPVAPEFTACMLMTALVPEGFVTLVTLTAALLAMLEAIAWAMLNAVLALPKLVL